MFVGLERAWLFQLAEHPQDCGRADMHLVVATEDVARLDRPIIVMCPDLKDQGVTLGRIREGLTRRPRGRSSLCPSSPDSAGAIYRPGSAKSEEVAGLTHVPRDLVVMLDDLKASRCLAELVPPAERLSHPGPAVGGDPTVSQVSGNQLNGFRSSVRRGLFRNRDPQCRRSG